MISQETAKQALTCLDLKETEQRILFISDHPSQPVADPIFKQLSSRRQVTSYDLDQHSRPLESVPQQLKELGENHDLCIYLISKQSTPEINERTFRTELNKLVENHNGRVANRQ